MHYLHSSLHYFDWANQLHVCKHAAFLVAFSFFLRISNLVPYTLASCKLRDAHFLKRADVLLLRQVRFFECLGPKLFNLEARFRNPVTIYPPFRLMSSHSTSELSSCSTIPGGFVLVCCPNHCASLKPILAALFNRFSKSCVALVGINPSCLSSRSFRQGGATFAFNGGAPTEFIKAQGDWRGDAYLSTEKKLDLLQAISARLSHLDI